MLPNSALQLHGRNKMPLAVPCSELKPRRLDHQRMIDCEGGGINTKSDLQPCSVKEIKSSKKQSRLTFACTNACSSKQWR